MKSRLPGFGSPNALLSLLFLSGWITYQFSLVDLGRYSILLWYLVCPAIIVVNLSARSAATPYIGLPFISGVMALIVALLIGQPEGHIFGNLVQYLLGLMLAASVSSIDWDRYYVYFGRYLAAIAALVFVYGLYQFFARRYNYPYGFLSITNLQLSSDEGLQRGASNILTAKGYFGRVSSVFPEPSDMGRFFLWNFSFALLGDKGKIRVFMLCLSVCGVLLCQSLGAVIGLMLLVLVYQLLSKRLGGALIAIVLLTLLLLFVFLSESLDFAVGRRIVEYTTGGWDTLLGTARFAGLEQQLSIILDRPFFGYGLGQAGAIVDEGVIGSSVVLLLIERGLVGLALFVGPWIFVLFKLLSRWERSTKVQKTACLLLFVESYCLLTFAMLYFSTIYFAYGFAVWALRLDKRRRCKGGLPALRTPR